MWFIVAIAEGLYEGLTTLLKLLRVSWKEVVVASIGLIVSLAVLSNVVIVSETYENIFLNDLLSNQDQWIDYYVDPLNKPINQTLVGQTINETLATHGFLSLVQYTTVISSLETSADVYHSNGTFIDRTSRFWEYHSIRHVVDPILRSGSHIEENIVGHQKGILLVPDDHKSSNFNSSLLPDLEETVYLNFSMGYDLFLQIPVEVVGLAETSELKLINTPQRRRSSSVNTLTFAFTNFTALWEDLQLKLKKTSEETGINLDVGGRYSSSLHYNLNLEGLGTINPNEIVERWDAYEQSQKERFFELEEYTIDFSSRLRNSLQSLEFILSAVLLLMVMFALPTIVTALFLAYYAFGLVRKAKLRQIEFLLSRGISRVQLGTVLMVETLSSLVVAIVLGMVLSIPISSLVVNTEGFLTFSLTRPPVVVVQDLVVLLAQVGLILVFLTNLGRVVGFNRASLASLESEGTREQSPPFWKKRFVDIILLGAGLLFYGLFMLSTNQTENLGAAFAFLMIFMLISPILLVVGTIMTLSRLFPWFTRQGSGLLWRTRGSLGSLALRNLLRHKNGTVRTFLLIAVTLAFVTSFLIFPQTINSYNQNQSYYQAGAEVTVILRSNDQISNVTYVERLLSNISSEVQAFTTITQWNMIWEDQYIRALIINPSTFENAAWMREKYTPDWRTLVTRLSENSSVLLHDLNMIDHDISVEDDIHLLQSSSLKYRVMGSFNLWPHYIFHSYDSPYFTKPLLPIMSYETFHSFNNSYFSSLVGSEEMDHFLSVYSAIFIKPVEGANLTHIQEILEDGKEVQSVVIPSLKANLLQNSVHGRLIFSQVNSNIIFGILLVFLVTFLFGMLQLVERGKEVATERALGMTVPQTFQLILCESLWVFGWGTIVGLATGIGFATMYVLPFTIGQEVPPLEVSYPLVLLGGLAFLVLIGSLLFSFLPSYLSSKLEVTRMLKAE